MRVAVLVLATVVLVVTGDGALAAPPLSSLDKFAAWLDARDAATVTLALVRLVALVASGWLAFLSLVAAGARALGFVRLAAAAELSLPRSLRRVAAGLVGTGMVLAVAAPPAPASAQSASGAPTVMTMTSLPPAPPVEVAAPPPVLVDAWTVAPGDSFWSIAEELVGEARGRPPSDEEVEPYWRALVDANRDRLVTASPDLLYAGQQLALPAVS